MKAGWTLIPTAQAYQVQRALLNTR
jgi:hypothetical protein